MRKALIAVGALLALAVVVFALTRPHGSKTVSSSAKAVDPLPPLAASGGERVFDKWCAPCHGRGPGHPGTQSLEVKYKGQVPAALEDRNDLTPATVEQFTRHGIALMPFFRKTEISDAELKQLGDYLSKGKH